MEFHAEVHSEVQTGRLRVSTSVRVSLASAGPQPDARSRRPEVPDGYVPQGLRDPGTRWGDLPPRVLPTEWSTGVDDPPGGLVAAETRRGADGYAPPGG